MVDWLAEFEGRQKPLDELWTKEMSELVGPLRCRVTAALDAAADPEELLGLRVLVYADDGEWGFKLQGPPVAVNYATALIGIWADISPRPN